MAAPEREERISPAVLQQQAGQYQAKRQEGAPGRTAEHGGRDQRARAGQQARNQGGPGALRHGTPPGDQVLAAVPDQQRVRGQASRAGERKRISHVREAEGAKLCGPQLTRDVEANGCVAHAAHGLIRQTPAKPLRHPAWDRPNLGCETANHGLDAPDVTTPASMRLRRDLGRCRRERVVSLSAEHLVDDAGGKKLTDPAQAHEAR